MAEWVNADVVERRLIEGGWLTPDTYNDSFAPLTSGPAVYLFALFSREAFYESCVVAYVGMSTKLKQRLSQHEILDELDRPDWWVKRWFLPTRRESLMQEKRKLIAAYDPPWNIVGRKKGFVS